MKQVLIASMLSLCACTTLPAGSVVSHLCVTATATLAAISPIVATFSAADKEIYDKTAPAVNSVCADPTKLDNTTDAVNLLETIIIPNLTYLLLKKGV